MASVGSVAGQDPSVSPDITVDQTTAIPSVTTPPQLPDLRQKNKNPMDSTRSGLNDEVLEPESDLSTKREDASASASELQEAGGDSGSASAIPIPPHPTMRPASPFDSLDSTRPSASPHRARHSFITSSPGQAMRSSSPRLHSPASSQIFERSVQEDITPAQASPSIPTHIMTENHIPPILEASSAAITDDRLDPDSVEIITHSLHQPACASSIADHSMTSSWHEDMHSHAAHDTEDTSSMHANLDPTDVRRLSFVSFADVVHGEHVAENDNMSTRGSLYMAAPPTSAPAFAAQNRSPSPVRSPVSSHGFGTSPPTSVSPSFNDPDASSPNRRGQGAGSPLPSTHSPSLGSFAGELNVETMTQALRRTGSSDLSGFRSQPMSAVGNEEGSYVDRPFK